MKPTVSFTVDGQVVQVPEGTRLLEAAKAIGIEIPNLCNYPELTPAGICRLCLVEVDGRLVPSCTTVVQEGLQVRTNSDSLYRLRRLVLELILSDHPQDCLTCDKAGGCPLQRYAYEFKLERNRFVGPDHERRDLAVREDNPFIRYEPEKCILCGRCIRACAESQGRHVLNFYGRGFSTTVGTALDLPLDETNCELCGQCVAVCPTGALTEKERRFKGQEWELKKVETVCPFCGCGCPLVLHLKNGGIVRASGGWKGFRLCVKGRFGWTFVHHRDRLKYPLLRKNGELVRVSWDEALDFVAKRLVEIRESCGPEAIAGLASAKCTNEENYLFQKFMRAAMGTPHIDHCARLCHAPSVAGLGMALGSGAMTNTIDDLEKATCILVTGSNTSEAHPIVAQAILGAVRKGAKLVVVDPRRIELADVADIYLQPRTGTDVAWLNGLAHVIYTEGLWNKKFVEERCENFEEFREAILEYPPERVEEIAGIPAEELRRAARAYAQAERGAIVYSMGITQHAFGTNNVLALANLALLTGHIGRPGTGVNPLRGQNNVQGSCDMGCLPNVLPGYQPVTDSAARGKFERAWGVQLPDKVGLTVVEMMEAARQRKIKALLIMGENPMVSSPELCRVKEGLEHLELLVVMDIFPTETTEVAHVVLPAASFAEKDGTFTNTERRVQRVRKALEPPGEAKADWEIISELSTRMGYPLPYTHPEEIMREIATVASIYGGISHARLEKDKLHWPCPHPDHPGTPILHAERFTRGKGKFHGVHYYEPAEVPDRDYPFILTTGRMLYHYHTRSMTGRVEGLQALVPEAYVEINPHDAKKLGISDRDLVQVTSRRASVKVRAWVTERVPPGTAFMSFHFPEANRLTSAQNLDPLSKMASLKCSAVRVEPAPPSP